MCKMFAAAGRFQSLDMDAKRNFHRLMSNLFKSTGFNGVDQDAAGFYAWSGDRTQLRHEASAPPSKGDLYISATTSILNSVQWSRLQESPCKTYLCHARGAMSATVPLHNNHPFEGSHVALMHEGWISSHRDIAEDRGLTLSTDTDSELFMRIANKRRWTFNPEDGGSNPSARTMWLRRREWDPIECMSEMLQMTNEPTALCFTDHSSRHPRVFFGKNDSATHPFFFIRCAKYSGIFLVSLYEMWKIAVEMSGENVDDYEILYSPKPFDVCVMDWENDSLEITHG